MLTNTIILVLTVIVMIPGIVAVFVMLPGIFYILAVAFVYAFSYGFMRVTWFELSILVGIFIMSIIVDQLAGILGAKWVGARTKTLLYGIAGAVIGTLIMPFIGTLAGLFIGLIAGELAGKRTKKQAIRTATYGLIGTMSGMMINAALAVVSIALFVWFAL